MFSGHYLYIALPWTCAQLDSNLESVEDQPSIADFFNMNIQFAVYRGIVQVHGFTALFLPHYFTAAKCACDVCSN